jgi:dTDP-glucose 4,6-dehydratase
VDFVLQHGSFGEIYNISSGCEKNNLEITAIILTILGMDESMIEYVPDRSGHDWRYSLDSSKLRSLGWQTEYDFETAMRETVNWYRNNEWWWRPLKG